MRRPKGLSRGVKKIRSGLNHSYTKTEKRTGLERVANRSVFAKTVVADNASVAQLVEQGTLNPWVQGSSPCGGTKKVTNPGFPGFFYACIFRQRPSATLKTKSRRTTRRTFDARRTPEAFRESNQMALLTVGASPDRSHKSYRTRWSYATHWSHATHWSYGSHRSYSTYGNSKDSSQQRITRGGDPATTALTSLERSSNCAVCRSVTSSGTQ